MLLISAGASGGDYAVAVVRQTLHMRSPFMATVVCGRNDALRQRIEQLVAPAANRYRVLGFTAEMPQLLRRADPLSMPIPYLNNGSRTLEDSDHDNSYGFRMISYTL